MTATNYLFAWAIYVISALGLCMILFQFLNQYFTQLRLRYLAPLFVILLTPYFSAPGQPYLAPAIWIALFETAFGESSQALKALIPIGAIFGLMLGASIYSRKYQPKAPATSQQ